MTAKSKQKNSVEYISLSEAACSSGYTPEYLNSLARKEKLKAKKIGRNWYTTSVWLDDFVLSTKSAKKEKIEKLASEIHEHILGQESETEKEPELEPETEIVETESFESVSRVKAENVFLEKFDKAEVRLRRRWKTANIFTATLGAIFLLVGVFQIIRLIAYKNFGNLGLSNNSIENYFNDGEFSNWISADNGVVLAEETTNAIVGPQAGPALVSENYKIKEIKFGGALAMASGIENPNLEIYDIRSDLVKTSSKDENKLMIKWRTNKLALSSIEYSPMNGSNPKKLFEENYGFGHSVILSGLEPGTAYTYVIQSKDKWANQISSDRYSAYTGTKVVSVFDLIINAVKEVFGWAIKK